MKTKMLSGFCFIYILSFGQSTDSIYTNISEALVKPLSVRVLRLNNQSLSHIPAEVSQFKNIRELNLINNPALDFEKVLGYFSGCQNLGNLYLDDNKLTILPKSLGALTNLKRLELNYNDFYSLDTSVLLKLVNLEELLLFRCLNLDFRAELKNISMLPKLESLWLTQNRIEELPKEIGYCRTLKKLDLQHNRLSTLPSEIGELKELEYLYLRGNRMLYFPEEMRKLQLKKLDIGSNNITKDNLEKLQELLPSTDISM